MAGKAKKTVSKQPTPQAPDPREQQRVLAIIARLKQVYPTARCSLDYTNPCELMVATILSAQCTDERVNLVTKDLFAKYPSLSHYAAADVEQLRQDIRSINFYQNKAMAIQGASRLIMERHGGQVPRTIEELVDLPGIGRKTANVILGNAFGIAAGVVVDTHVKRLSNRLGLTQSEDPEKIEKDLNPIVPQADWVLFPHLLIHHGRQVCQARKPKCGACVLSDLCPSAFKV